jgi:hypothetical protein
MTIPYFVVYSINGSPIGRTWSTQIDLKILTDDSANAIMAKIYMHIMKTHPSSNIQVEDISIQSLCKLR